MTILGGILMMLICLLSIANIVILALTKGNFRKCWNIFWAGSMAIMWGLMIMCATEEPRIWFSGVMCTVHVILLSAYLFLDLKNQNKKQKNK